VVRLRTRRRDYAPRVGQDGSDPGRWIVAAEYGSVFEGNVAAQRLIDSGIRATASYDPALDTPGRQNLAASRVVEVLVDPSDVEAAREMLAVDNLPPAFRDEALGDWAAHARSRRVIRIPLVGWLVGAGVLAALVVAANLVHH
jgi:hypothetical protein